MRAVVVVVVTPGRDQPPCLAERTERHLVQEFVAQPGLKALLDRVLHRLAGLDIAPGNAPLVRPGQDHVRGQLRAVVGKNRFRPNAPGDDAVELRATRAPEIDMSGTPVCSRQPPATLNAST